MTITDATAHSINCAYANIARAVGLERIANVAKRMGITSPLPLFPSMALGVDEVSPLEMADAYATMAADGIHHKPIFVDHILDRNGKTVFAEHNKGERAISAQNARVSHPGAQERRGPRHRHGGRHQRARRVRKDGNVGEARQRVVRRRHAATRERGVDGRPAGQHADDRRGRHHRGRRLVPGAHWRRSTAPRSTARHRPSSRCPTRSRSRTASPSRAPTSARPPRRRRRPPPRCSASPTCRSPTSRSRPASPRRAAAAAAGAAAALEPAANGPTAGRPTGPGPDLSPRLGPGRGRQ